MNRYARQITLPEIGIMGQKKLATARLVIVGAGGLGVPALQYVVGAGIGHITLIDHDTVETSNLHRQPIYGDYQGQLKVMAARQWAYRLNPDTQIEPVAQSLTPSNVATLISHADLVLDCADNYATSYTLSDACQRQRIPLIMASALGLSGYVGGFCAGAPSLRALFPAPANQSATCASAGVLGPVVGLLGTLQAQMTLNYLLDLGPSPLGRLIRTDISNGLFSSFRFDDADEPCGPQPYFIDTHQLHGDDCIIELRDRTEAPQPVSPHAIRLDITKINLDNLPLTPQQRVVFACRTGIRAWRAAERLATLRQGSTALIAAALSQD